MPNPDLFSLAFRPDYWENDEETEEIEIAVINVQSVLGDSLRITAEQSGDKVQYKIMDGNGGEYHAEPETSSKPLTMHEIVEMIRKASPNKGDSLPDYFRQLNLLDDTDPNSLVDFVSVESDFYPELQRWYEE